ncbi:response regulator [Rhodoferax sp. UBA5149]|uniref:response regulator n=1 Tax=Rhodoferax sp. UBA5149 TaxID=1947379 RepID=UPI0025F97D8B|nr:response regulator [Rhodoferax sp. UBA5149]
MNGKMKILIVDDEEVVRASHLRLLSGHCCYVEAALNGADALREMERDSYDLVLLDLRMPGLDGMSVLRMIKQRWPESEVVVITGYPSVDTAKEAIRLGAYDYLAKPVDPDCVIKVAHCAIMQKKWTLHRVPTPDAEKMLYA